MQNLSRPGIAGTASNMLADAARWHELHAEITALLRMRDEIEDRCLSEFEGMLRLDPRSTDEGGVDAFVRAFGSRDRLLRYREAYIASGAGDVDDRLDALWKEQDPISERLRATPTTVAEALAVAGVWLKHARDDNLRRDNWGADTCEVERMDAGLRAVAEAGQLLGMHS